MGADTSNHRIQVFDQDGIFIQMWGTYGSQKGQFSSPEALALDNDVVYVTEYGNHRIQIFNRDGTFVRSLASIKSNQLPFNYPTALAVDNGTVYMTEAYGNCVQVFKLTMKNQKKRKQLQKRQIFKSRLSQKPISSSSTGLRSSAITNSIEPPGLSDDLMYAVDWVTKEAQTNIHSNTKSKSDDKYFRSLKYKRNKR